MSRKYKFGEKLTGLNKKNTSIFSTLLISSCKKKHEKNQEKQSFEWSAYNRRTIYRKNLFVWKVNAGKTS